VTFVGSPISPTKKLPFILDILPHLHVGDTAPVENFRKMMQRWEGMAKPHFVADSAFGSYDLVKHVTLWGGSITVACPPTTNAWLWEVLSAKLPPNYWRAAEQRTDGVIASIRVNHDGTTYQRVFSNGWNASQAETLPTATTSEPAQPNSVVPPIPTDMPRFSQETLEKMKVVDLREICKLYNIKTGRKKTDTIQNILKRSNSLNTNVSQLENLLKYTENTWKTDSPPIQDFYRECFNLVDLSDKRWYSVEEHHPYQHWETKMLFVILRNATINSWVHSISGEFLKFRSWRELAYRNLMESR